MSPEKSNSVNGTATIVGASYASLFLFALTEGGRGLNYPIILKEFHLSTGTGSFFFSSFALAFLLANFTAPKWLQKISPYEGLRWSIFAQAVGGVLTAWGGHVHCLWALATGPLFFGAGGGGANICMTFLINHHIPQRRRRFVFSGLHSVYALGWITSPYLLRALFGQENWFTYFYLMAGLFFLVGAIMRAPHKHGPQARPRPLGPSRPSRKARWKYGLFLASQVAAEVCLSSRLTYYLQEQHGWSSQQSGDLIALFFLLFFLGRLFGAIVPERIPVEKGLLAMCLSNITLSVVGLFITPWAWAWLAFPLSLAFPYSITWACAHHESQRERLITSMFNFTGALLVAMHFTFGHLAQALGAQMAMLIPLGLFCLGLLLLLTD